MENPGLSEKPRPAEDWAGEMGARWLADIDRFESMIAPIGHALLARADYGSGEHVADIGCGGGATSLAIASAVGPTGTVTGVDISPDLAARANQRAETSGLPNVRFYCADAASFIPPAPLDRLFSRFGSMFFSEPHSAFTNLHGWLTPNARLDIAVWGPPRDNPWMMEMMGVLRRHIEVPPSVPRAPGPFAFEDLDYLTGILTQAGFSAPDIDAYTGLQPIGGHAAEPEEAVRFAMSSLAVGRLLEGQTEDLCDRVEEDLLALFRRNHFPGQGVLLPAKAWLVTARA